MELLDIWDSFILLLLAPEHRRLAFYIFILITHPLVFPDFDSSHWFHWQPWKEIATVLVRRREWNGPSWVAATPERPLVARELCEHTSQLWESLQGCMFFSLQPALLTYRNGGFSLEDLFITVKLLILLPFQLDKTSRNYVLHGILSWITRGYSKLLQEKEIEYIAHLILHRILFFSRS